MSVSIDTITIKCNPTGSDCSVMTCFRTLLITAVSRAVDMLNSSYENSPFSPDHVVAGTVLRLIDELETFADEETATALQQELYERVVGVDAKGRRSLRECLRAVLAGDSTLADAGIQSIGSQHNI